MKLPSALAILLEIVQNRIAVSLPGGGQYAGAHYTKHSRENGEGYLITRRLYGKLRLLLLLFIIDLAVLVVIADLATGIVGLQGDGLFMVLFMLLLIAGLWLLMVLLLASGLRFLHRVVSIVRPRQPARKLRSPRRLPTR